MSTAGPLPRLTDLSKRYDGVLSDVWGVLHNGVEPYPDAVRALSGFRTRGGRVVLITNAARTSPLIGQMLDDMGVPRNTYDAIVTSGDVTRHLIEEFAGRTVHHVGPRTDDPLLEGLGVTKGGADEAAAVVITGLERPDQTPDDYADRLQTWRERDLPLICANPDKVVEIGDRIVYCAGALADIYAEMGGRVEMAGKPYAPIYQASLEALDEAAGRAVARSRVLAVGDSARTDATGAAAMGIDFLFITGSIHADELDAFGNVDEAAIRGLIAPTGATLAGFQPRLA